MKKWLKRIGIGVLIVVLVVCAITYVRITQWRKEVTKNLLRDSLVVQTAKGPIEYAEIGHGPPVLITHGNPGGYDQVYQVLITKHKELDGLSHPFLVEHTFGDSLSQPQNAGQK